MFSEWQCERIQHGQVWEVITNGSVTLHRGAYTAIREILASRVKKLILPQKSCAISVDKMANFSPVVSQTTVVLLLLNNKQFFHFSIVKIDSKQIHHHIFYWLRKDRPPNSLVQVHLNKDRHYQKEIYIFHIQCPFPFSELAGKAEVVRRFT